MDCSLSGSSVHGILQVRVLEGVAISVSRGMNLGYSVLLRLNPSIAVQTLLLTMRTTPFLLSLEDMDILSHAYSFQQLGKSDTVEDPEIREVKHQSSGDPTELELAGQEEPGTRSEVALHLARYPLEKADNRLDNCLPIQEPPHYSRYPFIHPFTHLSVLSTIHPSTHLSVHPFTHPSVYSYIHSSI